MADLKVDVWSDIACPWCYVGKRRFERAVAAFDGSVTVEYHSFELAPDTPVDFDGSEAQFLASHQGIALPRAEQMLDQMTQLAAAEGLHYDYAAVRHTNTRLAHETLHLAKTLGRQVELKERLLAAYFVEGRHLGQADVLAELATQVGIDRAVVTSALEAGSFRDAVVDDIDRGVEIGVTGVPFHVIDGRFAVAGAQDPAVFTRAFERASAAPA